MSVGGSKQSGTSSSNVTIPQFLEPFIRQSTGFASDALGGLAGLIAPRPDVNYSGPPIALNGVRGPSGPVFVDPARNAFVDTAGTVIAPLQDGTVPGLIHGNNNPVRVSGGQVFGQGSSGQEELFSLQSLQGDPVVQTQNLVAGFTPAQTTAQQLGIDRVLSGFFDPAQQAVSEIAGGGVDTSPIFGVDLGLDSRATDTLAATSRGDFLFGGDGFNAAVDAAVRQATPGILSTFGAAGAGGATGGLAQEALGTAAIDAFARQYAQERQNQIGAAGLLGSLGLESGSQLLRQATQGVDADLRAGNQQLNAAQLLPGLASADLDLLSRIGGAQQAQAQSELDAPRNALLQLLTASLGGTPISSLLGQNQRYSQQGLTGNATLGNLIGDEAAGEGLASLFF